MHEMSLMADLMRKIERVLRESGGGRIVRVRVALGAQSHLSPEHFREHFEIAVRGTAAEGASLEIGTRPDRDIVLDSVDIEE